MKEIIIHKLPLPTKVRAMTIPDSNGDFTVILNSNLSDPIQRGALAHELRHIDLDHFYNEDYVAQNEFEVVNTIDPAEDHIDLEPDEMPSVSTSDQKPAFSEPAGQESFNQPACAQFASQLSRSTPLSSPMESQSQAGLDGAVPSGSDSQHALLKDPPPDKVLLPTSVFRNGKQVAMLVARRRPLDELLEKKPDQLPNRPL